MAPQVHFLIEKMMAKEKEIRFQSPEQVVNSPHLAERGFFVELDHPEVGKLKYPGAGFFFDGANLMQTTRGAPRLGEHNDEVYCGRLGLSKDERARQEHRRICPRIIIRVERALRQAPN